MKSVVSGWSLQLLVYGIDVAGVGSMSLLLCRSPNLQLENLALERIVRPSVIGHTTILLGHHSPLLDFKPVDLLKAGSCFSTTTSAAADDSDYRHA